MSRLVLGCALLLVSCGRDAQPVGPDAGSPVDGDLPSDGALEDAAPSDGGIEDAMPDAPPDAPPVDETPPALTAITPATGASIWLGDTVAFTFDEPIEASAATISARLNTAAIGATLALEGDRTIVVKVDPAARGIGTLDLRLGGAIRDAAGNAATLPIDADYAIPAWHRPTVDRGPAAGSPAIAVADDGTLVAAWLVGAAGARRVAVGRFARGAWSSLGDVLGGADASSPAITLDASNRPIAGWIEGGAAKVARWDGAWSALPSPGNGARIALARPAAGGAPSVLVAGSSIAVSMLSATDTWQAMGAALTITGTLVGEPALAVPAAGKAVVAWIDSANSAAQLRASRFTGAWTGYAPIPLGSPPTPNRASIAARGDTVAIAWDQHAGSFGVYAAKSTLSSTVWTRLGRVMDVDAAGDARAPAIEIDAGGAPVVAWTELVETQQRGVLARWGGSAWTIVGGPSFLASAAAPTRPALALRGGGAAVLGWSMGTTVAFARFNGPKTAGPGMTRASLAGCSFDAAAPPTRIRQTGCFTLPSPGKPVPHAGLVPYDIVAELWSDGTRKRRWVALPPGTSMTMSSTGAWLLPVNGFTVKEFAIETTPGDPSTRRAVETRFFVRTATGFAGFTYQWRTDGSDADLLNDGQFTKDWQLANGTYTHVYPSRSQCLSCHEGSWGPMLGLRPQQLARWADYNGTIADQLATLVSMNVGPASTAPAWISPHDASATVEQRTRSYMAANCAHCHNPDHIAIKDLRPTTPLAQTRLCESIVPGSPNESVVYARVTQRPGMPPLGTLVADPLAGQLLYTWIHAMTSCP